MTTNAASRRAGTILIIDDDEVLTDLLKRMVERAGFNAVSAASCSDALEIYRSRGTEIALVITDLMLGGGSGRGLVQDLLRVDPSARILVTTGFYDERDLADLLECGAKDVILKPFSSERLLEKIHAVLAN
ncbi:MAG: response regulator [Chthonomonadales bacterium]